MKDKRKNGYTKTQISNHISQRPRFYQISPYLGNIIQHENNIRIENG